MVFLDEFGQRLARAVFAVDQHHPRPGRGQAVKPGEQIFLAGMGAEPAERVDLGFDGDLLATNADSFLALDQPAAGSAPLPACHLETGRNPPARSPVWFEHSRPNRRLRRQRRREGSFSCYMVS